MIRITWVSLLSTRRCAREDRLEYGCEDGTNTLPLARRGAKIIALDISPDLIEIARHRLVVNNVNSDVKFMVVSAHDMPAPDASVDVVFGTAILHYLDLELASREVKRVLRKGGKAIFQEPVRNSRFITAVRRLIPYKSPEVSPFERPLTDKELADFARGFSSYRSKAFALPTTNLINILPPLQRYIHACYRKGAAILRRFPALTYYATTRVVEMVKLGYHPSRGIVTFWPFSGCAVKEPVIVRRPHFRPRRGPSYPMIT